MRTPRETMVLCACCPAPCRRVIDAAQPEQIETKTPSAMALIALAVMDGEMDLDDDVRQALSRTPAIRACQAACPYELDMAAVIDGFVSAEGHPA